MKLSGKTLLEYAHEKYEYLQRKYYIPQKIRPGKHLMDFAKKDPKVLRQYRCLPISRYYSMLLENTPGYERNTSCAADQRESTHGSAQEMRSDQNSKPRSDQNLKPPIVLMRGDTPSHPPDHPLMRHRVVDNRSSSSSASKERPQSSNVDYHDGDQWMERRAKQLARRRNNPVAGEEYESESGNEWDEYDHSHFDKRMTPSDKTKLARWMWQIKRIKSGDYPMDYIKQRSQALDTAQEDYERRGVIASYLSDVPPPWNKGKGLAITRFNEKIIKECEEEISNLREKNANRCAQENAENKKKQKVGLGVKEVVSTTSEKPTVLRPNFHT
jgi:hypothetical protein